MAATGCAPSTSRPKARRRWKASSNQIKALLVERHDVDPAKPDFVLQTQQDIISTQQATTEAFRNLLAWVAAVSLVVGGIGIMNIMLVSVTERTREIGLRQALGARPRDVLLQFLIEAVTLSLVGGLVGVLLGVGGAELFGRLGDMRDADRARLGPAGVRRRGGRRHLFRLLPRHQGGPTRSDRGAAPRITWQHGRHGPATLRRLVEP